jgi:hypothetical protein
MSEPIRKTVSRILSRSEAQHLYDLFTRIECYKVSENGNEKEETCPGWSWDLEHLDDANQPQKGGCRYKNAAKLCSNLKVAAEGMFVIEIRPKNEEDEKKDREYERSLLEQELRRLKTGKMALDEQILALENKMRNL